MRTEKGVLKTEDVGRKMEKLALMVSLRAESKYGALGLAETEGTNHQQPTTILLWPMYHPLRERDLYPLCVKAVFQLF